MLLSMTMVDGANKTTYYYHYNARGDVVKLTDQDGTEVASYTYDAWGNILSSSGTMAGENPYRYAGYRYDSDINLYYLMARYYNPDTGRFLSKDPIPDAVNDYIYSGNNPVNYVDPEGERYILIRTAGKAIIKGVNKVKKVVKSTKGKVNFNEGSLKRIFRDAPGHLKDTPANRKLLTDTANNSKNYLGKDKYGNEWYAQVRSDGSQVWVQVRNGEIRNGGLNATPRDFNPVTGLSNPVKP